MPESNGPTEASTWRIGPFGPLVCSVVESVAGQMAQADQSAIYFYADLADSSMVTHEEETMQKVHEALVSVGLSEGQTIGAINAMQNSGILFREHGF